MGLARINTRRIIEPATFSIPTQPFSGKALSNLKAGDVVLGINGGELIEPGLNVIEQLNFNTDVSGVYTTTVDWSPDGRYFALGHASKPYISIYDWSTYNQETGEITKVNIAQSPNGAVYDLAWSPNGKYLAIVFSISPYIIIYDWSTGEPIKLANPAFLPTGAGRSVTWSPDNHYLAVAYQLSPYVTIYDMSAGIPIKIADLDGLPSAGTYATINISWSPNGRYLAIAHNSKYVVGDKEENFYLYDWSTEIPSKITFLAAPGNPQLIHSIAWSPCSNFFIIGKASGAFHIYSLSSGSWERIIVVTGNPSNSTIQTYVSWSPDSKLIAISRSTLDLSFEVFRWVEEEERMEKIYSDVLSNLAVLSQNLTWHPDSCYLIVTSMTQSTPITPSGFWGFALNIQNDIITENRLVKSSLQTVSSQIQNNPIYFKGLGYLRHDVKQDEIGIADLLINLYN